MLQSLPVELIFNDLRDAQRRANKAEATKMQNLHSVAVKSVEKRQSKAFKTVNLSDSDWCEQVSGRTTKKEIYEAASCKLKDVGLERGLRRLATSSKLIDSTSAFLFTHNLQLMQAVKTIFKECNGCKETTEQKSNMLWISQLFCPSTLVKLPTMPDQMFLVVQGGPWYIKGFEVIKEDCSGGCVWSFPPPDALQLKTINITSREHVTVANITACVHPTSGALCLQPSTDFEDLHLFVLRNNAATIKAGLLIKLCDDLNIKGHKRLGHKARVKFILEHFGFEESFIQQVLEQIPDQTRKRKALVVGSL